MTKIGDQYTVCYPLKYVQKAIPVQICEDGLKYPLSDDMILGHLTFSDSFLKTSIMCFASHLTPKTDNCLL